MIKKLQALRAKKGFTLVELVVVIAIIGVLAAILVPTMLGVVEDSRVTAADTAANQIKTQTTTWFTNMDAARKGFKQDSADGLEVLGLEVTNGVWSVTSAVGSFGGGTNSATWSGGTSKDTDYCLFMADVLRDIKNATVNVHLENRAVVGVIYVEENGASMLIPADTDWDAGTFAWGGTKAGISSDGTIYGSSPKLGLTT